MISKNRGFTWFAVMVLSIFAVEDGMVYTVPEKNSVRCSPVYTVPGEACGWGAIRLALNNSSALYGDHAAQHHASTLRGKHSAQLHLLSFTKLFVLYFLL